jgi:hypothetical protein
MPSLSNFYASGDSQRLQKFQFPREIVDYKGSESESTKGGKSRWYTREMVTAVIAANLLWHAPVNGEVKGQQFWREFAKCEDKGIVFEALQGRYRLVAINSG